MRRLLSLLVKAAVSALLLYLAFRSVDLSLVAERLNRLDAGWVVFVLTVLAVQGTLLALRWRQIVIAAGAALPYPAALRYTLTALFFNQTLPSTVGGDAARIWLLGRSGAGFRLATYSVLIDRGVGMFALTALVAACLPWTLSLVRDPIGRAALVLIAAGSIVGALFFVATALLPKRLMNRLWITRHLATAAEITLSLCRSAHSASLVAVLSFAIHVLTVTAAWGAAKSIAVPLDFAYALFLIPPVILIATVPISIAGWGVREGVMIAAFAYAGLAEGDGLIVSVIFGTATFVVGACGGLIWVLSGERLGSPIQRAYERR